MTTRRRWWMLGMVFVLATGGCAARPAESAPSETAGGEAPSDASGSPGSEPGGTEESATSAEGGLEAAPGVADHEAPAAREVGGAPGSFERLLSLDARLAREQSRGAGDCATAAELVDEICRLAERVCMEEDAEADVTEERCDDGRARCVRGRERLASACAGR